MEEGFVEEAIDEQQQIQVQATQDQQQNPQLRGRGGALPWISAGTFLLGIAVEFSGVMRKPRYGYGMTLMMGPMMRPRMMSPLTPMGMRGSMMMGLKW